MTMNDETKEVFFNLFNAGLNILIIMWIFPFLMVPIQLYRNRNKANVIDDTFILFLLGQFYLIFSMMLINSFVELVDPTFLEREMDVWSLTTYVTTLNFGYIRFLTSVMICSWHFIVGFHQITIGFIIIPFTKLIGSTITEFFFLNKINSFF